MSSCSVNEIYFFKQKVGFEDGRNGLLDHFKMGKKVPPQCSAGGSNSHRHLADGASSGKYRDRCQSSNTSPEKTKAGNPAALAALPPPFTARPSALFPFQPHHPERVAASRKPSWEEQVGQEGLPPSERAAPPPRSGKGKGASQAKLPSSCLCLPPPKTGRLSAPKPPAPTLPEAHSTGRTALPSLARRSPFASLGQKEAKGLKNPLVGKSRLTFPGSSRGRGTFRKHLFRERLCRMEF